VLFLECHGLHEPARHLPWPRNVLPRGRDGRERGAVDVLRGESELFTKGRLECDAARAGSSGDRRLAARAAKLDATFDTKRWSQLDRQILDITRPNGDGLVRPECGQALSLGGEE